MKQRILFINGHLNAGGVERSLVDLLQHIDYNRFEVELLLLEDTGDYLAEIPPQVAIHLRGLQNTYGALLPCLFRCLRMGDRFSFQMRLILLLAKLFGPRYLCLACKPLTQKRHYDYAIGFRSGICTQVAAFSVKADKKITWWHHGEFNVSAEKYEQAASVCDAVAVVSENCADMLGQHVPTLRPKLRIVPNMVDGAILRKKCGTEAIYREDTMHWVTVCRISPEKHVENILYAAKRLKQSGISFLWHIVGDGALKSELEELAASLGIQDCVRFEGRKANPYPYLKDASMYIHPSYVESQGLAILEAMELGIPCVAVKTQGTCAYVKDGINGVLVEPGWEALARAVRELSTNQALYEKIRKHTCCPEEFHPEHVMERFERVLEEG